MKYIIVTADTNDADYINNKSPITDEQIAQLMPLIEAIKNFKPYKGKYMCNHNWTVGDCFRGDLGEKTPEELYEGVVSEEVFEMFNELLPWGEYGIHTIKMIEVIEVVSEIRLL